MNNITTKPTIRLYRPTEVPCQCSKCVPSKDCPICKYNEGVGVGFLVGIIIGIFVSTAVMVIAGILLK